MLKPLFIITAAALSLTACSVTRQASNRDSETGSRKDEKRSLTFIKNISVTPGRTAVSHSTNIQKSSGTETIAFDSGKSEIYQFNSIENSNWLQFKYAIMLKVPVEVLTNTQLLHYVDEWYATRYRYGGENKDGVDCSAFTSGLLEEVFGLEVPRTCREQYRYTERVAKTELREGDLVFFKIHRGISHVGVYLTNNKFVHASTSSGVMISDLEEAYFARRYAGAGRVEPTTP